MLKISDDKEMIINSLSIKESFVWGRYQEQHKNSRKTRKGINPKKFHTFTTQHVVQRIRYSIEDYY